MSLSCHGKPRQLCWRPRRLMASTLPSQAEEVMSQGRTPGLTLFPSSQKKKKWVEYFSVAMGFIRQNRHNTFILICRRAQLKHSRRKITNINKDAAEWTRCDENNFSVESNPACFVFKVRRNPGQEFCVYISSVSYLLILLPKNAAMHPCLFFFLLAGGSTLLKKQQKKNKHATRCWN